MAFIDMKDYGPSAKLYWWTVTSLGVLALAWGVGGVLVLEPALMLQVVIGAAVEAFVASYRTSKRWTSRIGSPAMAALAMLACAVPFEAARSQVHANGMTSSILLAFAMVFAGLYYSAN